VRIFRSLAWIDFEGMAPTTEGRRGIRRPLDVVLVLFLASHIPVTLFFDAQIVLPASWFPDTLRDFSRLYLSWFNDPLLGAPSVWFRSLVWCELLFQLPFFFLGTYAMLQGRSWIRLPALLYVVHVLTTMVPIGAVLCTAMDGPLGPITAMQRLHLVLLYLPYAVLPALLGARAFSLPASPSSSPSPSPKGRKHR